MRVAIFSETFLPKWDGVANTVCRLLECLHREGHETLMFAPEGAPPEYAGTPIVGIPCFPLPFYTDLKLMRPARDMGLEVLDFAPDVVHLVNPAIMGMIGLKRARSMGAPVVASYHTDIPGYTVKYRVGLFQEPLWAYFKWLHNQADLNVCPTETCRTELRERGFARVKIWGRGVDSIRFTPHRRRRAWRERLSAGDPDAPLLLFVSRLAVEKRLDVVRPVLDAFPHVNLAVVGEGPQRGKLEEMFAGTNTVFTGYLTGDDLADAYAAGDVFVFPGEHETFGNVVLEAMSSGLPVLAARAGGPCDHVHDGRNGYLFEPGDSDDLITRLSPVLGNPLLHHTLSEGARTYAESQSWDAIMKGLIREYESLVETYRPMPQPLALASNM